MSRLDGELAQPLHLQQLERYLDVRPFLSSVRPIFAPQANRDDESTDEESDTQITQFDATVRGIKLSHGIKTAKDERRSDKMRLYNFDCVEADREWLKELLVSDSSESEDNRSRELTQEDLHRMLKQHLRERKWQARHHTNPENFQYQYYATGLLSNYDKQPEQQRRIMGNKKKKKDKRIDKSSKKLKKGLKGKRQNGESQDQDMLDDLDFEEGLLNLKEEDDPDGYMDMSFSSSKSAKAKKKAQQAKNPEIMAIRRKKIWIIMCKKELGKVQRAKVNNHKEMVTTCKRVAQYCLKLNRQKALQSQKNMKETIWRAKRLTREMQGYWKRYDRVERDTRRRQEKEAEEQRKLDGELMEAKRQQRKLNFLITQTELYAHFMSKKLVGATQEDQLRILSQLEEDSNPRLAAMDDYDVDSVKYKAKKNVEDAMKVEQARTRQFAHGVCEKRDDEPPVPIHEEDRPQPSIFHGQLKHYQLKGMNWLANLYDQGINGILADEMGLGKTVQSIAFLCHIAEKYDAWGPFLIISPASTLHNWQQEMARFVPDFKVVPYWGSPQERKILRQFWDQKDLHTREASFHVVITSYQLVITDFKYFNRIRWQYLILDEAQALKSTNSVRWKLLLGFSCRNRLLLSGTPIQNSMAELWALLHFIMPTMFDSHDEFNEWFSKDIESHAENKTGIDEKHLSRLHMILKPFMLRRIKKDVENELSDKIEIMVYCPLTTRQQLLYSALKKKIRIEDLLYSYSNNQSSQSVTSSLMNLVMQFRKVCNHPELFERREVKAPLFHRCQDYVVPRLVYDEGILSSSVSSTRHLLCNKFSVFVAEYIHRTLLPADGETKCDSCFSFTRLCGLSPQELSSIALGGLLFMWQRSVFAARQDSLLQHRATWWSDDYNADPTARGLSTRHLLDLSAPRVRASPVLADLVFTERTRPVYTFTRHTLHAMQETVEHRILRSRKEAAIKKMPLPGGVVIKEEPLDDVEDQRSSLTAGLGSIVPKTPISPSKLLLRNPIIKVKEENHSPTHKRHLLPEHPHVPRPPVHLECQPTDLPAFLYYNCPRMQSRARSLYCSSRASAWAAVRHEQCGSVEGADAVWYGGEEGAREHRERCLRFFPEPPGGLEAVTPRYGWHNIVVPDKQTLVTDAGKLYVLDALLKKLKEQGHRVLIYSQMTRMIDLLEEYMWHRKHTYIRLDGSSKISDRRDMVADFQSRDDIFVFLLSTRAGGLGINLTAADTVIFYDSDWNPTVDQQAMDRAHRLGQTKQVTVYRLICKGSIEERILQRAREKSEIQRMVISGGNFKPDTLKPKEVVSLLLDDEEIEKKYRQKQAEKRTLEETRADVFREKDRKRKQFTQGGPVKLEPGLKRPRFEELQDEMGLDSAPASPCLSELSQESGAIPQDETSNEGLVVDVDSPSSSSTQGYSSFASNMLVTGRPRPTGRGGKRGRPRGSKRGGCNVRGRGGPGGLTVNMTNADLGIGSPTAPIDVGGPSTSGGGGVLPGVPTPTIRRGPGRPRLKPVGPGHQGMRGVPRPRKVPKPLLVPVRSGSGTPGHEHRAMGFYTPAPAQAPQQHD